MSAPAIYITSAYAFSFGFSPAYDQLKDRTWPNPTDSVLKQSKAVERMESREAFPIIQLAGVWVLVSSSLFFPRGHSLIAY